MAPIHAAARRGDLEEVMRLVQQDPEVVNIPRGGASGSTALHSAAQNGHLEVVCYLLDQGAEVNTRERSGWTHLTNACTSGNLPTVQLLVSRGANTTTVTPGERHTLLISAAVRGKGEVVRYLLGIKAVRATNIIDAQDCHRRTALWNAAWKGHLEVVKLLVEAGANPMMADSDGVKPITIARHHGHHECIELLQVGGRGEDE